MRILGVGLMVGSFLFVTASLMVFMFYPSLIVAAPAFCTGVYLCSK